mmetsp:Transcript_59702/g.71120  ORF Transcript_59702/g.71120 Transcript_59702/m.71120 type:complete len:83 (+) Transcript_59702:242-490(+)
MMTILDNILHPMSVNDFLANDFKKKAVHVSTKSDKKKASKRISMLLEAMYDRDVNSIFKESSSENIFVWLPEKKDDSSLDSS